MARFVALANEFLAGIAAEPGMGSLPKALEAETAFRVPTQLYYTQLMYRTGRSPLGWLAAAFGGRDAASRAAIRHAGEYLDVLVESNSSRIANDLIERTTASRAKLESEIRKRLREVSGRVHRAVAEARRRIGEGQGSVRRELARLERLEAAIEAALASRARGETT
jgi:hypothetical protein